MTKDEFERAFEALSQRIAALPEAERQACRGELHALVERAEAAGLHIPEAVLSLDEQLSDAAIEAQFDNLPL
ncbi:hypothetical protein [Marimonas arenosa]|uniref:Uncharacterized protein n=1 Tax=Marimonas arenosa TaxID=1795305 RepID=A0AAE3WGJ5_9RHOB|nr:hypothetical protein [Marimonas arenosa]MDQ2091382.1 hypothetical protein [Marimonas arenosa]